MDSVIKPKLFISYAHADGESAVKDFWDCLQAYLKSSDRIWDKWDDKEILVGQDWDDTIRQALEEKCNCCLLLVSDLFAKSSYIRDKEWPKTLERYKNQGIVFFPVVFGVLEGGLEALPSEMKRFQVYWPTVSALYVPPPTNVPNPDQMRQCYIDAMDKAATRHRYLSQLAIQMNERFDEYSRTQSTIIKTALPEVKENFNGEFITNNSDAETFAKAIFGSLSYEKRYRDSSSKGCYFPRQIDSKINEHFSQKNWVLIEGHPLSGKTRAVFEAIKLLMTSGNKVVVWPFKAPTQVDQPLILPELPEADYRIVWMDDIDARFRNLEKLGHGAVEINHFLERIADTGAILVSTARTGPAYYDFRHRFGLNDHLWDKLERLPMRRLEGEEEKDFTAWYQAAFGNNLPDKFDHHPGSLFLNLETMNDRWHNMDKIASNHNMKLDVDRAKDIMRALHVFYIMEAFQPGGLFLQKDIQFYLKRRAERKESVTAMAAAFNQALSGFKADNDWETLVEFLSQDQYHLGFLRQDGESLFIETAYLDYIVAHDAEKNIVKSVVDNFSRDERQKLGLTVNRYNFGEIFSASPPKNEKDLEKLVRKLKPLGLANDISVWNQIIFLCPTIQLVRRAMTSLEKFGLKPDMISYNSLLNKVKSLEEGRSIITEMRTKDIKPDRVTYTTLLGKSDSLDEGQSLIVEMKNAGVQIDVIAYTILLNKVTTLEDGHEILSVMYEEGVMPNAFTYATFLNKMNSLDEGRVLLTEMRKIKIKPDIVTYNTLLKKSRTLDEGRAILDEMSKDEVKPNVISFTTLLSKAPTIDDGRSILAEMNNSGIKPDAVAYTTLIGRTHTFHNGCVVLAEMRKVGLSPSVITYNTLMDKARTLDDGQTIFAEMRKDDIKPEVDTYNILLDKLSTLADGRAVFAAMRNDDIKPDVIAFSTLLNKAPTLADGRAILAEMRNNALKPDVISFSTLLNKVNSLADGHTILEEMREDNVKADVVFYNTLLDKTHSLADGRAIFEEMRKDSIKPDSYSYNTLLKKALTWGDGQIILVEMRKNGVKPDSYTYRPLFKLANSAKDVKALLTSMEMDGVIFNNFHKNAIKQALKRDTSPEAKQLLEKL